MVFYMVIHVVSIGETIESVAQQYGVSAERLAYDNQLAQSESLVEGQALLVLFPTQVHQVVEGETLAAIANVYQVSVIQLIRNNPYLAISEQIVPGQYIVIQYEEEKVGSMTTNGYAYPFIDNNVLRETLPYLTYLAIFSYGFTMDGELIGIDDEPLITQAQEFGVEPVLVLTPFSESGIFDNNLVHTIVSNPEVQERVIQNLLLTVGDKGYSGVDVDFEFILAEDRDQYVAFITNLTNQMNAAGYFVSVALAPKISDDQIGLLYEGVDYSRLGAAANSVLLMTYEWGYTYGPPMAVAPINSVRRVLDFAVSVIPPEKTDMGIPNYGYDWPLPYERGVTAATTIGNPEAIEIARANGATIEYDEESQSPFFYYSSEGVAHVVWFEDVRSMQAKFNLIPEYGFRGVGYWQLMKLFRANWLLLNVMFNIV